MPANYVLLEKITVGASGASSVTFSGIPQTGYTDLVIKVSARDTTDNLPVTVSFNGSAIDSGKTIKGNGSGAFSGSETVFWITPSSATSNTFGSAELYIPNYTGSTAKSMSIDAVTENNGATAYTFLSADLENGTSAITSISLAATTSFTQNSTFYLYGVAKLGTTPTIAPYATGGDTILTDGTYWYHTFTSSGTFTPAKGLSCDVLVVAGGGGGGGRRGAGAGAGGFLGFTSQSFSSNQTVTIGAGGSGGNGGATGYPEATKGSDSQLGSLTLVKGGGAGDNAVFQSALKNGGSGGGSTDGFPAGTATSGQGNAGGIGSVSAPNYGAGGGGGAGAVGGAGSSTASGAGGNGLNTYSSWASATSTGVSGYYAGGGGGGNYIGASTSAGGAGGGGIGTNNNTAGGAGVVNTGSGGGGGGYGTAGADGGNGGSGIVIVRYAV